MLCRSAGQRGGPGGGGAGASSSRRSQCRGRGREPDPAALEALTSSPHAFLVRRPGSSRFGEDSAPHPRELDWCVRVAVVAAVVLAKAGFTVGVRANSILTVSARWPGHASYCRTLESICHFFGASFPGGRYPVSTVSKPGFFRVAIDLKQGTCSADGSHTAPLFRVAADFPTVSAAGPLALSALRSPRPRRMARFSRESRWRRLNLL